MGSSGGELELQRAVDELAKKTGWRRFALPTMRKRGAAAGVQSSKGWPDRAYFRYGRILVLEFKPEDGRAETLEQAMWLEEWRMVENLAPNVKVAVVRPSDFDTVKGWFV